MKSISKYFLHTLLLISIIGISIISFFYLPSNLLVYWGSTISQGSLPKYIGSFILPLTAIFVYGLFTTLPKIEVFNQEISKITLSYNNLFLIILGSLLALQGGLLYSNLFHSINIRIISVFALAASLYFLGELLDNLSMLTKNRNEIGPRLYKGFGILSLNGLLFETFFSYVFIPSIILISIFLIGHGYYQEKNPTKQKVQKQPIIVKNIRNAENSEKPMKQTQTNQVIEIPSQKKRTNKVVSFKDEISKIKNVVSYVPIDENIQEHETLARPIYRLDQVEPTIPKQTPVRIKIIPPKPKLYINPIIQNPISQEDQTITHPGDWGFQKLGSILQEASFAIPQFTQKNTSQFRLAKLQQKAQTQNEIVTKPLEKVRKEPTNPIKKPEYATEIVYKTIEQDNITAQVIETPEIPELSQVIQTNYSIPDEDEQIIQPSLPVLAPVTPPINSAPARKRGRPRKKRRGRPPKDIQQTTLVPGAPRKRGRPPKKRRGRPPKRK